MWIPMWVIAGAVPAFLAVWFIKVWKFDIPAENRAAIAKAEQEKREIAALHEGWRRGDGILEDLVANGAPSSLLAVRKLSDRAVREPETAWMDPCQTLRSYERFHEAMKLHEAE